MPNLLVMPSIDIKDGKTVRIVRGIPELNCEEYGDDPVKMALIWRAENAKCLHVVDFNTAQEHSFKNLKIIEQICKSVIIPVQVGGGITSLEDVERVFDIGAYRVVIGTMIYQHKEEFKKILYKFGPNKIVAAIDVIDNEIVIKGREIKTGISAKDYANDLVKMGVERIIVTDVKSNGMMTGPNITLSAEIAKSTGAKITLSGGVGGYQDLKKVNESFSYGIDSVIIGRALYENKFPCQKIWRVAESGIFN